MTSHLNIDWEGTRELNRREFNTNARWNLTHNSAGRISTDIYSKLAKEGGKGTKYEADPLVSVPSALRKDLHRREVGVEADLRARSVNKEVSSRNSINNSLPQVTSPNKHAKIDDVETATVSPLKYEEDSRSTLTDRRSHCHRKHKKNCPKHLLNDMRRRKEAEKIGIIPVPFSEVLDGPSAIPCTIGMKTSQIIQADSNVDQLIKGTPFLVGRSMAYVFTGSYDPSVNVRKHRMEDEHPNFTKNDKKVDQILDTYRKKEKANGKINPSSTVFAASGTNLPFSPHLTNRSPSSLATVAHHTSSISPSRMPLASTTPLHLIGTLKETPATRSDGPHRHLTHTKVVPDKLLKDACDPAHYRRKYDMKTHMEKMRSMGPGLLREFANGKGFK